MRLRITSEYVEESLYRKSHQNYIFAYTLVQKYIFCELSWHFVTGAAKRWPAIASNCEHRAAHCLAAFQRTMRGGNILQCEALVNLDLHRTFGDFIE